MQRRRLRAIGLTILGALAVAIAAGTLGNTTESGAAGSGDGGGSGGPVFKPPQAGPLSSWDLPTYDLGVVFDVLVAIVVLVMAAVIIGYVTSVGVRRAAVTALAIGLFAAFFYFVWMDLMEWALQQTQQEPQPLNNGTNLNVSAPGEGDPSGTREDTPSSLPLLAGLVVLGIGGVIAVFFASRDADDGGTVETGGGAGPASEGDVSAMGRAAGRAADRIEAADDPDNEVFRAWREMVLPLDVPHPESCTSGEFAAAAVEAGMDPEDVTELTDLFDEVRYGGEEPTPERERRAVETLRRIEETYGEGEE